MNKNKIKVMNIVPSLEVGGVEQLLLSIIPEMDHEKYDVCLCSIQSKGFLIAEFKKKGIEVITLGWKTWLFPYYVLKLAFIMKKRGILIAHTHLYPADIVGTLAGCLAGIPFMLSTKHNEGTSRNGKLSIFIERTLSRFHKLIISDSQAVKRKLLERGYEDSKIITINPSNIVIDTRPYDKNKIKAEYRIPASSKVIGIVARLRPVKGHEYLIEAFSHLHRELPQAYLVMVGSGELEHVLKKKVDSLNLNQRVVMIPYRDNIYELLAMFDVFVLSSISEGLPISVLEAMAAKKAIVATEVGGIPELIRHNQTGILVPPRSPQALCNAILFCLQNEELGHRMGNCAYNFVKNNLTLRHTIDSLDKAYASLLSKQKEDQ